jgi:hypothetical protein
MSWALGLLAVAALAGLATGVMLAAVRRTARRQQQGLPPLPECPPAPAVGTGTGTVTEPGGATGIGTKPGGGMGTGASASTEPGGGRGTSAEPGGGRGTSTEPGASTEPSGGAPLLRAAGARYLGTTYAPSSVRRFSGYGLLGRGVVGLALEPAALRVERGAAGAWCIPAEALRGAEVATHHAGKAVYAPRVLVVDWTLGDTGLRSGFVLDQPAAAEWASRLNALVLR